MVDISKFFEDGKIEAEDSAGGFEDGRYTLAYAGSEEVSGENEKTGSEGWQGISVHLELSGTNEKIITLKKLFIFKYAGDENHKVAKIGRNDFAKMMAAFGVQNATDLNVALMNKYVTCLCANKKTDTGTFLEVDSDFGKAWEAVEAKPTDTVNGEAKLVPTSEAKTEPSKTTLNDDIPF